MTLISVMSDILNRLLAITATSITETQPMGEVKLAFCLVLKWWPLANKRDNWNLYSAIKNKCNLSRGK